ncbi:replicative DNA helicase [Candidatus Karelsulcia muelleri]|uniref:replicative DNA helicase n=1 Tax=Candidatus Karelsulcia muelleri TaxID=336810 RepID=UPI0023643220|nr:replicative DNA helicase [Candidatus Karelsulcia muelleri]WDE42181.1 replicative DNA helicase [Candidatus Karelsulcia muelleri]WDR79028.1 replicative DNA helicase [Candidatus Karelsulcia muelleri]
MKELLKKKEANPKALNLEEAVIGGILIDPNCLEDIIDIIEPEIFYKLKNKEIIKVIRTLYNNSEPIDIYTVSNELKKIGKFNVVGGDLYLTKLTNNRISSANIEYHSKIIKNKFILRQLIETSYEIIKLSQEEKSDVLDLLNYAEMKLFKINNKTNLKDTTKSINSLIKTTINNLKTNVKNLNGIPSGFRDLDKITCGWQNSELIIFAARPGMGKTSFALSMARNIVVNFKIPILIFSLEMSATQLVTRLISAETGIPSERLKYSDLSKLEWKLVNSKIKSLSEAPLYIDDTHYLSIFDLRCKCRREISKNKIKLIIIDYLQLMTSGKLETLPNLPREQEVSFISRNLKAISKEFNLPIIALSQLSRAVETRGGRKRPILSDLRESGALEQDADIVTFIYRPEYYGFTNWDNGENESCKGEAELIIAKNRNGRIDNVRIKFVNENVNFSNLNLE